MRAVIQRVRNASVTIDGKIYSEIKSGLAVLLGVAEGDTAKDAEYLAEKIVSLRIFEDEAGKMNKSVQDIDGELLIVSQFTLLGDARKGRRPSFIQAASPDIASSLYDTVVHLCRQRVKKIGTGQFQAHMLVNMSNDGPVTILLDSKRQF